MMVKIEVTNKLVIVLFNHKFVISLPRNVQTVSRKFLNYIASLKQLLKVSNEMCLILLVNIFNILLLTLHSVNSL